MRWLIAPAWIVGMAACIGLAQDATTPAQPAPQPPPPVFAGVHDSLLLPSPVAEPECLWKEDRPNWHFQADVGLEMLWTHWGNAGSPAFGPNVSLGVFNERGWGLGANWMELEQSTKSSTWGPMRRP
jgi:hypothetical protein